MAEVATPPQQVSDANLDIISAALAVGAGRAPMPPAPPPPANNEPAAAAATPAVPASAPPAAAPTAAPGADDIDPLAKAILGLDAKVEWSDEAKNLFKATYGEDDPFAFKEKYTKVLSEAEQFKKSVQEAEALKAALKRVEDENPAFHAALIEQMEGRDGLSYLSKLPNANILGKKPTDLNDETILRTYLGDKFSEDEWKAYRTGDYDEINLTKEVMEAKIKALRPVAEHMHEQRNIEYRNNIQQRERSVNEQREAWTKAQADSIAHANLDPYAKLYTTQDTIEAFRSGALYKGLLTQEDGATPHPNMLSALIKAKHFDEAVKRAFEAGKKLGEQRGLKENVAQLPTPRPGGRVAMPADERGVDPYADTLAKVLSAR